MLPASRRPILAVHGSPALQEALARVLPATLRPLLCAATIAEARAALVERPEIIVIDHRALAEDNLFLVDAGAAGVTACVILLSNREPTPITAVFPATIPTIALSNLIDGGSPLVADELVISVLKLLRRDVFGMEKYLSWRAVPVTRYLNHSAERRDLVDEMREHITGQKLSRRLHWLAAQAADELLSNAIYHGPVNASGEHFRAETPRSNDFPLAGRDQVRLRYGADGHYFCLEVRDQYGSLDRATLVRSLHRKSRHELSPRASDSPGAGIGLALTAGYVSHLVCNLEPGKMTELIALFDLRPRKLVDAAGSASFNAFVASSAGASATAEEGQ